MSLRAYHLVSIVLSCVFLLTGCRFLIDTDPHRDRRHKRHERARKAGPCHPGHGPPPHAPAHGYRAKCGYTYYPHAEVYYSRSAELYFYKKENGDWGWGARLPDRISIEGDSVDLTLETNRPYEKHDEIKRKYGGDHDEDDNGHPGRGRGRGQGPPGY